MYLLYSTCKYSVSYRYVQSMYCTEMHQLSFLQHLCTRMTTSVHTVFGPYTIIIECRRLLQLLQHGQNTKIEWSLPFSFFPTFSVLSYHGVVSLLLHSQYTPLSLSLFCEFMRKRGNGFKLTIETKNIYSLKGPAWYQYTQPPNFFILTEQLSPQYQ